MVGTRPKNKLGRIKDGTKIDLTETSPKKTKPRKPMEKPAASAPTPDATEISTAQPENSQALALAAEKPHAESKEKESSQQQETTAGAGTEEAVDEASEASQPKKRKLPQSLAGKKAKTTTPSGSRLSRPAESSTEKQDDGDSGEKVGEEETSPMGIDPDFVTDATPLRVLKFDPPTTSKGKNKAAPPIKERKIAMPKAVDFETLARLGVDERVKELFEGIGWGRFLEWPAHAYEEFVMEAYGSMKAIVDPEAGPLALEFLLNGEPVEMGVNDINLTLGMIEVKELQKKEYKEAERIIPLLTTAEWSEIWGHVSDGSPYKSQCIKGHHIKEPALRICHRIIAYNLFGKKDSGNAVANKELYILGCMLDKKRLNFGAILVEHLRGLLSHPGQRYSCAHFTTRYALNQEIAFDEAKLKKIPEERLDMDSLIRMKDVRVDARGRARFTTAKERDSQTPAVQPTQTKKEKKAMPAATSEEATTSQLDRIEATLDETRNALLAYFAYVGFRYSPDPSC